jgi:hypothetical protein
VRRGPDRRRSSSLATIIAGEKQIRCSLNGMRDDDPSARCWPENAMVAALSAYAQEEDRHRSQDAGFNAHLTQSVRLDLLKEVLVRDDFVTAAGPGAYKKQKQLPCDSAPPMGQ